MNTVFAPPCPAAVASPLPVTPTTSMPVRRLFRIRLPSWGVEAPAWREARRERTSWYVTDERRSGPGWIGVPTVEFILIRTLSSRRA
jgi:hypothetical protein